MNKWIGGVLLVAGTTIGAGMLALPLATGFAGFLPALLLLIVYWAFMTYTAMLFLEANLWFKGPVNLISLMRETLGRAGELIGWVAYLFLLYALTTAYFAGSAPLFELIAKELFGLDLPSWAAPLPLLMLFGVFIYGGAGMVDAVNRALMAALALSFITLVFSLAFHLDISFLKRCDFSKLGMGLSIAATSFGFHIIIPSLTDYFERDVKMLKSAILVGSLIPLIVYSLWELLTLGIVPLEGKFGIYEGYQSGADSATLLSHHLNSPFISSVAKGFSFFAIITSFMGVSLSLNDFLADGLHIKKHIRGRLVLLVLTFGPPLAITLYDPRAFLSALEYAGAFGVVFLLGLMPSLIVWRGRSLFPERSQYRAPGGNAALLATAVFSVCVIAHELFF